jgi:hypothetical protein
VKRFLSKSKLFSKSFPSDSSGGVAPLPFQDPPKGSPAAKWAGGILTVGIGAKVGSGGARREATWTTIPPTAVLGEMPEIPEEVATLTMEPEDPPRVLVCPPDFSPAMPQWIREC